MPAGLLLRFAALLQHPLVDTSPALAIGGLVPAQRCSAATVAHPKPAKPIKAHRFQGGRCRDCGDIDFLAGPDCEPPVPTPDSRAALPFDPAWFRQPLEALHRLATTKVISLSDAAKWKTETTYLLEEPTPPAACCVAQRS